MIRVLYVRYDKPKNLVKEEFSAYVSFKWSQSYVDGIKALPLRYWIPEQKNGKYQYKWFHY